MLKKNRTPELYFLLAVLAGLAMILFCILQPFFYALILAMVFATAFYPVYKKLLKVLRGRAGLAALLTLLGGIVLVVTPLIFLGLQIFQEAQQLYVENAVHGTGFILKKMLDMQLRLQSSFPFLKEFSFNIDASIKQSLHWLMSHLGVVFGSVGNLVVGTIIFMMAFYFLLKDGQTLKSEIIKISPLSDEDHGVVFQTLKKSVDAVLRGSLLVALSQGSLALFGFVVFGLPNPVLWAMVTTVSALIPGIGTSLVLIPVCIFLFFTGHVSSCIGLGIWSAVAVGLIDNFLGPRLMRQGMHIHPLLILLSVLGGIGYYGPIGILLGPILMSLFFALLKIYSTIRTRL